MLCVFQLQIARAEGRDSPGAGGSKAKGSAHDEGFLPDPLAPVPSAEAHQDPPAVAEGKAEAATGAAAAAAVGGSGRSVVYGV